MADDKQKPQEKNPETEDSKNKSEFVRKLTNNGQNPELLDLL
jgi:hypothetical protein